MYKKISTILIFIVIIFLFSACKSHNDTPEEATTSALSSETTDSSLPNETTDSSLPSETTDSSLQDGIIVSNATDFQNALDNANPGSTIYLRSGTYKGPFECSKSGKKNSYITITSYPNEKVTLTFANCSEGAALAINGNKYIVIRDIYFTNLKATNAYGVLMTGGESYITIDNCEFSKIVTSAPGSQDEPGGSANAILLLGESKKSINHITIKNNTIHDNINGWAENISVAGNCEYIYVRNNKVYNCTNIGIDFYGNAEYCSTPALDHPRHCECTGNTVYNCKSFYAENAGIYVDGSQDILIANNTSYNNFYGIEIGSEEWRDYYTSQNRVQNITIRNNNIHDNSEVGLRIGGWSNDNTTGIVYNCYVQGNKFNNNCNEIILSKCDKITFDKNTFTTGLNTKSAIVYDDGISKNKISNIIIAS